MDAFIRYTPHPDLKWDPVCWGDSLEVFQFARDHEGNWGGTHFIEYAFLEADEPISFSTANQVAIEIAIRATALRNLTNAKRALDASSGDRAITLTFNDEVIGWLYREDVVMLISKL